MDGGNWKEFFNAACEGDIELVRYHVERGVDVNYAHPEFLSTPLVACALAGQEEVALYLLESGANPGLFSEFDGKYPIQAARSASFAKLEAKLVALGASMPAEAGPERRQHWLVRLLSRRAA